MMGNGCEKHLHTYDEILKKKSGQLHCVALLGPIGYISSVDLGQNV